MMAEEHDRNLHYCISLDEQIRRKLIVVFLRLSELLLKTMSKFVLLMVLEWHTPKLS